MSSISPVGFNQDLTNFLNTNNWGKNHPDNLLNIVSGQSTLSTISSMGQQINNLYSLVKSSGDKDVEEGFKTAMLNMRQDVGNVRSINFFKNIEKIGYTDMKNFNKTFTTLNELHKNGLDGQINGFIDTFNNSVQKLGNDNIGDFLDTTNDLIEKMAKDDRLEANSTMFSYLNTYNDILNFAELDKNGKKDMAYDFLKNLGNQETITAINQYINNFRTKNNL